MPKTPEDKIAMAQVLLAAGNSQRWVAAEVGMSQPTISQTVASGVVVVPAALAYQEQNSLDNRLTEVIDLFLNKAKELATNNKLGDGLKAALGMAVFIDKRNLLRGLPTQRTEDLGRTPAAELEAALREHPELAKQLKRLVKSPEPGLHGRDNGT